MPHNVHSSGEIARVGVAGAGQMGSGIAEVCARAGLDVVVCEADAPSAEAGRTRILASLDRAVRAGKLDRPAAERAAWRLRFTADVGELADRQLVIEAVAEDERSKTELFAALDKAVADPGAILAPTTSSIPIMRLGMATGRAAQVVGPHFFNPAPVLPLVEVVGSLLTSPDTVDRVQRFATGTLGEQAIRPATGPGSWSTRCSCRIRSRRSGWSSPGSPRPPTSTAAWNWAPRTRGARCGWPT
ncbi:3-hydroxybutyryl-CoA dehydrogenase [Amycolatopsis sp. M39]|uniref:3-hydroxybutyryl-CoA dehydrogenase n=1 Tax=Amycolatopsis rubida TaxID=112413 RepID=A0A1I5S686_9PSEU|nr:3-hydroxybutyryl-CoA dehydrogenase [Amycolatopsis sp. M39]SFP66187.1 3-hydroxybutyryl-CoA dehydrogenase [Amycolatopsis rubida]